MNTYNHNENGNTEIGAISGFDKVIRTMVAFSALLMTLGGIATTPLQYFFLSALAIYLVHTVIIGQDLFYAAVRYLRSVLTSGFGHHPHSIGHH